MEARDDRDALLDQLLCELVGGEEPPDLAPRILAELPATGARPETGFAPLAARSPLSTLGTWPRRFGWAAAAAVLVLAVGGLWWMRQPVYPAPQISVAGAVEGGGALRRGARLRAPEAPAAPAALDLGGYCHLQLAPESVARLAGADRAEELFLEAGSVACEVDRQVGTFTVRTGLGTVSVTGTKFTVALRHGRGRDEAEAARGTMTVAVAAGSVLVDVAGKSWTVEAGARKRFNAAGEVREGQEDEDEQDGNEQEIALDQVPAAVLAAAQVALPGAVFEKAETETKGGLVTYALKGTLDGRKCEVELDASGKVLESGVKGGAGDDDKRKGNGHEGAEGGAEKHEGAGQKGVAGEDGKHEDGGRGRVGGEDRRHGGGKNRSPAERIARPGDRGDEF